MKWGRVKLLALLLSLMLNASILLLGLSFYQSQQLVLSQAAGNQTFMMDFTLEIVASTSSKDTSNDLKRGEGDETIKSVEDESNKALSKSVSLVNQDVDQVDLIATNESANDQVIPLSSDIDEMREKEDSLIANQKSGPSKSLVEEYKSEDRQQATKTETESEKTVNLQARSGDQFASELADKIHARIEGCYPESSKRRGEEGVVRLKIIKDQQGLSVMMIESSGFKRLDRCAISAVEKILNSLNIHEVPATGIYLKPIRFQLH